MISQLVFGGIKHILCDSAGRGLWKLHLVFSGHRFHVPFLFVDFAWYPFVVINLRHEYDYMQSLVTLPSESSNLVVVLGTPNTDRKETNNSYF